MKAVTNRGMLAVRSATDRTRWTADSSGWDWLARTASILPRKLSPEQSTCNSLIIAIAAPDTTQCQPASA